MVESANRNLVALPLVGAGSRRYRCSMITKDNFETVLLDLGFEREGLPKRYAKQFPQHDNARLVADFDTDKGVLFFPEDKGLTVHSRTTCNFSQKENFVVFECVHRLLAQGYKPQHIELEPTWKLGHGSKGGRADILVKDNTGKALLIIECKTEGTEFTRAWEDTLHDGGQLLSYVQQARDTQYVCLYASGLSGNNRVEYHSHLVRVHDNKKLLDQLVGHAPLTFREATDNKALYRAWAETYQREFATIGLFEDDIQPYHIGKEKFGVQDLKHVSHGDIQGKYHAFATILRQHNVAGRENAFDKLINLFLCKIVDEMDNPHDLRFYWKGAAYDSHFDLQDRLQQLYQAGMKRMLKEEVTYITEQSIEQAFRFVQHDPDATRDTIKKYFRQLKFFTNNDFAFIDVHNEKLFYQNADVLLKIVRMLQDMRLRSDEPNQFLGDLFEGFLDAGVKQSEGQFFTPIPIVRFLLRSLPLDALLAEAQGPLRAIDYACGSGHFLTELAAELRNRTPEAARDTADAGLYGIEKEYRLSKVAKVSAFMYGQTGTNIVYADALAAHPEVADGTFRLLVANPPYSVKGFLQTLAPAERERYELFKHLGTKSLGTNNAIETFFVERAQQLLAPGGVAAIVLPSSILNNGSTQYVGTRELLLRYFDIVAVAQLGSRTFGKTGTNTVTLFLRRKQQDPAPADHYAHRVEAWFKGGTADASGQAVYQDEYLLRQYCQHQGWELAHYQTLLAGNPSAGLLAYELFADYQREFDKLTEIKNLKKSKGFKAKPADLQTLDLHVRLVAYLREQEHDKLYYFVLAAAGPAPGTAPAPVLLLKSPTDNQAQKQFLGYDWSGAKGNEGIKYLSGAAPKKAKPTTDPDDPDAADDNGDEAEQENLLENVSNLANLNTLLYDPHQPANPAKLNTYIQQNFRGEEIVIPEELQPYLSTARLVDMLDFSRVGFDKAFSMSPNKTASYDTHWPLERIENLNVLLQRGKATKYGNSGIQIIKSGQARGLRDFDFTNTFFAQAGYDPGDRLLQKGDVLINSTGVGTAGRVTLFELDGDFGADSHITILRANDQLLPAYLMYFLWHGLGWKALEELAMGSSGQIELTLESIKKIKVPVPPKDTVQARIVVECEAVEAEVAAATAAIAQARQQVARQVQAVYEAGHPMIELRRLAEQVQYGINEAMNTQGQGYKIFRMNEIIARQMTDNGNMKYADISAEEFAKYRLNKGDLLFNRTNSIEHVGKTGIFNLDGDYCFASYLIRVVVKEEVVDARFVNLMMNSDTFQQEAKSKAARSVNQANINATIMQGIAIPVPPDITVQQALAAAVASLETQIAAAEAIVAAAPARKQHILRQHLQGPAEAAA